MKVASLQDFRPIANRVLVKIDSRFTDHIKLTDDLTLAIDTSFEPEKHTTTYGTIAAVPDSLSYGSEQHHMPWDTRIETAVGDTVYFTWDAIVVAFGKVKPGVVQVEGDPAIYVIMKYSQLTLAVRDEQIIMLNGYCLIEEVKIVDLPKHLVGEEMKSFLALPGTMAKKVSAKLGKVVAIGSSNLAYDGDRHYDDPSVKVGQLVMFESFANIPIQYNLHADLIGKKILYKIQRRYLVAIIE